MTERQADGYRDAVSATAAYMAEQVCRGFKTHDDCDRAAAIDAFFEVDRRQFAHLDDAGARTAASAYVEALWAKDAVEREYPDERDGIDRGAIGHADWRPVEQALTERADAVGMDTEYASATTTAWRRHKAGGDYWTPVLRAQTCELRAALDDGSYPRKPSDGQSGYGPEATRYVLAVELHDMHTAEYWRQAVSVMVPYFELVIHSNSLDDPDLLIRN